VAAVEGRSKVQRFDFRVFASFTVVRVVVCFIVGVVVGGVVGSIIKITSSASSERSTVDCICGSVLRWAEGSSIIGFAVVVVLVVVGLVVVIISSSVGDASSVLCTSSSLDCNSSWGSQKVEIAAGVSPIFVFSVIAVNMVLGIVVGVVVSIGVKTSSSAVSAAVVCSGRCWESRRVGPMAVDRAWSLSIVVSVVTACSGVVVVVGCFAGIGVVVGKSFRRIIVSLIKPARMLAFSVAKSMRSGGTGKGWGGGGSARVGFGGCSCGVVVVGIVVELVHCGGVNRKSDSNFSATSGWDFGSGGAWKV